MNLVLFLSAGLKQLIFVFTGLIGIGFLIGLHEFGHFIFCKIFNVSTPSFSIGFGPIIWKKKIGETLFSISAIPLGGYLEVAGSHEVGQGEQKEAARADKRSLLKKPYWQKMFIAFGGIIFNMIFAYVVFIALFSFGIPKTPILQLVHPESTSTIVESVKKGSPAERAGIKVGDKIIAIEDQFMKDDLRKMMRVLSELPRKGVVVAIERRGKLINKKVMLEKWENEKKGKGKLGVSLSIREVKPQGFKLAIKNGIRATNGIVLSVFKIVKNFLTGKKAGDIGGPLMIVSAIISGARSGIKIFLLILAFISANLAALNIIPLPILDGGQALIYTIEAVIRRKLSEDAMLYVQYACWISFLLFIIYLTIKDIVRLVSPLFG